MRKLCSLLLCLTLALSLGAGALASGEPSSETVTQTWTEAQGAVSSYRPAPGVTLAFVPEARIQGTAASVDIYIDGGLYENVTAANYAELASMKDASGLNGKKDVVLTGVIEYADFDGGSVNLFNAVGPNDSILCIPNAEAEALARETFDGLFRYGTQAAETWHGFGHIQCSPCHISLSAAVPPFPYRSSSLPSSLFLLSISAIKYLRCGIW